MLMNVVVQRIIVAVLGLVMLLTGIAPAFAADPPAQSGGQGLEISPPVIELAGTPGQTATTSIRLRNVTKGDLVVNGQADDFGAKGENGEPQILLDEKEASRYSLKFWVQAVPSFRLKSQEVRTAQISFMVPQNAEPGGHYGVIRFTGVPPELEGTGVSLSASLGSLVLMRVGGNIKEDLSVAEFFAGKNGKKGGLFESGPVTLTERIKNNGSVHVKPVGNVEVFDSFGKKVASVPVSNPARNVLPDSIRRFDQSLTNKGMLGRYTAKFSVSYGSGKTLSSQTLAFWVIPWKLILLVLLVLVVITLALRQTIRRYNRHIINQARRK
jgi:hypothetical protein